MKQLFIFIALFSFAYANAQSNPFLTRHDKVTRYFDNVAAMQADTTGDIVNGAQVQTTGYNTPLDGGNNIYYYSQFSNATVDGGNVMAPLNNVGRFIAAGFGSNVSIRQFGAVGDSTIDESVLIQRVLDYCSSKGLRCLIPANDTFYAKNLTVKCSIRLEGTLRTIGTAVINDNLLRVKASNITIDGGGKLDGHLGVVPGSLLSGVNLILCQGNSTTDRNFNVLINNIRFQNNGYVAITSKWTDNLTVQNCIDTITDAFMVTREENNVYVLNNHCYGGTSEAISIWGEDSAHFTSNITVDGNYIMNKLGIALRYTREFIIVNNQIYNTTYGVYTNTGTINTLAINGQYNGTISNNIIQYGSGGGIWGSFANTKITNNTIDSVAGTGINITARGSVKYQIPGDIIANNTVNNTSSTAINLKWTVGTVLVNNAITDTRSTQIMTTGIRVDSSLRVSLRGNTVGKISSSTQLFVTDLSDSTSVEDVYSKITVDVSATNTLLTTTNSTITNSSSSTLINATGSGAPAFGTVKAGSRYYRTDGTTNFYVYDGTAWNSPTILPTNSTARKEFLSETSSAMAWDTLAASDIPDLSAIYLAQNAAVVSTPAINSIMLALGSSVKAQTPWGVDRTTNSIALNSQQLRIVPVWAYANATITGVRTFLLTQGVFVANNYNGFALCSYSGGTCTVIASTANDATPFQSTSATWINKDFSAPVAITPGLYFVVILYSSSSQTTAPALGASGVFTSGAVNTIDFTNSAKLTGTINSQTSLPTTITMSSVVASSATLYAELY